MKGRVFCLLAGAMVFSILAIACSDDDDDTQQGAESQACSDLASLETATTQMRNLNASSTVEEAQKARDAVGSAVDDLKESTKNLANVRLDDLEQAYASLGSTVNSVSGSQTLASVVPTIQPQSQAITAAQVSLRSGLRCP